MKILILKMVSVIMLCILFVGCFGCEKNSKENLTADYCRIGDQNLYYVTDEEKQEWQDALEELLKKAFVTFEKHLKDADDYEAYLGDDVGAIACGYSCGLFDVTGDGVPELLVHPYGYYGSSGMVTYYIYDIYEGKNLGRIDSGNDSSLCLYYDLQSEKLNIVGQYWLRFGWDTQDWVVSTVVYDQSTKAYESVDRLKLTNSIVFNGIDEEAMEAITATNGSYFVNGESSDMDSYYAEYRRFEKNCIRISSTEVVFIDWSDVSTDEDSHTSKSEKMADALINSNQRYIKPQ